MFYTELINKALDIAYSAHKDQRDKSGRPYIFHPFTVAMSMDTETEICTALLHDVAEDTAITIDDLRKIFPHEVTDAVDILTHRDGVTYEEYIRAVKNNPVARKVKLADISHNMDITRLAGNPDLLKDYEKRRKKYETAREILTG